MNSGKMPIESSKRPCSVRDVGVARSVDHPPGKDRLPAGLALCHDPLMVSSSMIGSPARQCRIGSTQDGAVSYTHLTLPTIYSV